MTNTSLSEDAMDALRILLEADFPVGWLDIGWDRDRWESAIAEIIAAGISLNSDA